MKKTLKTAGITLLVLLVLILLCLFGIKTWNTVAMRNEKELLLNHPGQFVEVDGKNMNIYIEGEGEHTIVFLSGWKTVSPIYEFKPLYSKLSDDYRCVVIEKFGYGFSDEYDGSRDFDTILRQDRKALELAGVEGPYVLCAHSLSGLEVELWAQEYPDEVEAIIGLDMGLADYYSSSDVEGMQKNIVVDKIGKFFGINRLLMNISKFDGFTDEEVDLYIAAGCKNLGNSTASRETDGVLGVCSEIKLTNLPDVPTIQYVSGVNKENELWVSTHQDIVNASINGRFVQLDCGHSVHKYEAERIAEDIKEFLN